MALSANLTSAQTLGTTNNNESSTTDTLDTSNSGLAQSGQSSPQRSSQDRDNKSTTINSTLVAAAAAATTNRDTDAASIARTNNDAGTVSQETNSSTDKNTNTTTNTGIGVATAPITDSTVATDANADTVTAGAVNTDTETAVATGGVDTAINTTTGTTGTNTSTGTATSGDADIVVDASANTDTATGTEPTVSDPIISDATTSDAATSSSTPTTPTAPSTAPLPTEGMVKASVPQPASTADIVGFKLTNLTAQANASEYVTFGQSFEKGGLKPGESLVATINGQQYAVQVDAKTFNDDGSISHAILTLKAPDLPANGSVDGILAHGTAASAGAALTTSSILSAGYDVKLQLTMNGSTTTIDAATALQQAIAAGKVETWMSGSQASEFRVTTAIDDHLKATFDIRVHANGEIKTDVIVTNEQAFTADPKTYTYDVAIKQNGATAYTEAGVQQWQGSTWHKEIYKNDTPDVHVTHDTTYLAKAGALLGYDTSIGVSAQAIADMSAALSASDTSLMGSSLIEKYMGQTGGRSDIGPMTQWEAMYLASQDPHAREVMLAQADAGGSIPWHFRDGATGDYVRIDQHPDLWIDYRASGSQTVAGGDTSGGGWNPELAHQPELSYLPYLITGTHYYLDELQAQAAFNIAADNPQYRDGANGIEPFGQIRALAWGLRDIANAMYMTPDKDPMHGYFEKILDNNLSYLVKTYITDGTEDQAKAVEGYILGDYGTPGAMAPWQQDYLVMALGRIAAEGNEDAAALMGWMTNFVAGRFINGDHGFDPLYGPAYNLHLGTNPNYYPTWSEVYQASGAPALTEMDGYPDWSGGYAAGAKGALATLITETHNPDAYEAFGYVISQTTAMTSDFANNPTFDIAPLLDDGTYLQHDHMWVSNTTSAETMNGTATDDLLHGGSGGDTLNGNAGIDLLYGAAGNDTLNGGDGNDYLFGGSSNDVLNGGNGNDFLRGDGGNDTMTGGAGVDTFSVDIREQAANTITDFQLGTDKIEVAHAYGADATTLAAQILAGATTDASGNVVLHLASGNDLTLDGVHAGQLTAASLFVTT